MPHFTSARCEPQPLPVLPVTLIGGGGGRSVLAGSVGFAGLSGKLTPARRASDAATPGGKLEKSGAGCAIGGGAGGRDNGGGLMCC